MAVVNTVIYQASDIVVVETAFGANGDVTSGNIAHGLSGTPQDICCSVRAQSSVIQDWAYTIDGTNLVVTKVLVTGTATLRFTLRRIHHQGVVGS